MKVNIIFLGIIAFSSSSFACIFHESNRETSDSCFAMLDREKIKFDGFNYSKIACRADFVGTFYIHESGDYYLTDVIRNNSKPIYYSYFEKTRIVQKNDCGKTLQIGQTYCFISPSTNYIDEKTFRLDRNVMVVPSPCRSEIYELYLEYEFIAGYCSSIPSSNSYYVKNSFNGCRHSYISFDWEQKLERNEYIQKSCMEYDIVADVRYQDTKCGKVVFETVHTGQEYVTNGTEFEVIKPDDTRKQVYLKADTEYCFMAKKDSIMKDSYFYFYAGLLVLPGPCERINFRQECNTYREMLLTKWSQTEKDDKLAQKSNIPAKD